MTKVLVAVVLAALAGYGLHGLAQSRIDVRPAVTPVASSSSNGVSFAWFYDTSNHTVYMCRAGQGVSEALECKAKKPLP
jgi:hypothetical protein